jgi:rhodanese-related sulfurtransferase
MPFWGHDPVPHIDADTAAKAAEAGALIIDLGEPRDWFAGHIKGAHLVEPELLDMELGEIPKDREIVIASRDQGLTEDIVASLREKGFDAAALDGGVSAWGAAGQEVVSTTRN